MPRTPGLQLSKEGKAIANQAFTLTCLTQQELADKVGEKKECHISRQKVGEFLKGEIPISRRYFSWFCEELGLEVDKVVDLETEKRSPQPEKTNPFDIPPGPVTNPEFFWGRKELLRQLFEELNKGGNLSLIGSEQVGKSSILNRICQLGPKHLQLPAENFINLDMRNIRDENEFFEELCYELGVKTHRAGKLKRILSGKRYILCLDEIDNLTREDHFTGNERTELCGLADGADKPFSLVIASQKPLKDLFPDSPYRTSPLAGICLQMDVKPFSAEETRKFINYRLEGTGVSFSESQIRILWEESQGKPGQLLRSAAELYCQIKSNQ